MLVDSSTPLVDSRVQEVGSVDSEPNPFLKIKVCGFKPVFFIVPALRLRHIATCIDICDIVIPATI